MRMRALRFEPLEDRSVPATLTVSNLNDSGLGSLRDAVDQANTLVGADAIEFDASLTGSIVLTTGEIEIDDSLSINGLGAGVLSVSGNSASRIFHVRAGGEPRLQATIAGLTLTNGNGGATPVGLRDGGAVLATGTATLRIEDSIIQNSVGNSGGGVAVFGTDADLIIENSQILNNQCTGTLADGGGVKASGRDFQFINSTADGNISSDSGGGLSIQTDTATVFGSTISNNIASDGGGGGLQAGQINTTTITNSTIAQNQAKGGFSGGGVLAFDDMAINNSTIVRNVENSEGGTAGIEAFLGANVTLLSSLVAENTVPGSPTIWAMDVGGAVTSLGNNFINDTRGSNGTAWLDTDILDEPSTLPALQANGGPTKTILPDGASFANGNGANPLNLPFDQRGPGFPRGGDIGAVSGGNPGVARPNRASGGSKIGAAFVRDETDATGFIRGLYFVVLGRDADPIGLAWYKQLLRVSDSRAEVAQAIWESAEHRTIQVADYYRRFLQREGAENEVAWWVRALLDGTSEEEVVAGFLGSAEYRSRFASNEQYVGQLYQDVLGRTPSQTEDDGYVNELNGGAAPIDLASSMVASPEARKLQLASHYEQILRRTPSDDELRSYRWRFVESVSTLELVVELAASHEFFQLSRRFLPAV